MPTGPAAASLVSGAILAGGRARRLGGACKPLLEVGGRRIVDRLRESLLAVCGEVVVVGEPTLLGEVGVRVVPDLRPGLGPLAGLEAALSATAGDPLLLVGGDMPFLGAEQLARLLAEAPGAAAVCFTGEHGAEPLCARYARFVLPQVKARLDAGQLALHLLLDELEAVRLPLATPADRLALANVNTPEELASARRHAGR